MRTKYVEMTPDLYRYVVERGTRQDDVLRTVARETEELGDVAVMQVAPEEGALLTLLARSIQARRAVEVGTFTGYSAICIARGLADGGSLVCCELDPERAAAAERNLRMAGLSPSVDVRVGPALDTLRALPGLAQGTELDFAFVDADKVSYREYYEEILARLRPGGLIVLDNVLLRGRVLDPDTGDASARAMAELNAAIARDERVDLAMLGIADGVTVVRKR